MKSILPFLLALACVACAPKDNHAPVARHVVFIGIDGWAAEAVRQAPAQDLPNIHSLMDHGSWTLSKRSVMPSASAINWASKSPKTGEAVPSRKSTNSPTRWQPVNT